MASSGVEHHFSIVFVLDEISEAAEAMVVDIEENAILKHGEQFADYLKKGLSDNWSQVRYMWNDTWLFLIFICKNSVP